MTPVVQTSLGAAFRIAPVDKHGWKSLQGCSCRQNMALVDKPWLLSTHNAYCRHCLCRRNTAGTASRNAPPVDKTLIWSTKTCSGRQELAPVHKALLRSTCPTFQPGPGQPARQSMGRPGGIAPGRSKESQPIRCAE